MTRHLDHDEIARLLDGYPHEDASSYEDSNIADRIFQRVCIGAVLIIMVGFLFATWRLEDRFEQLHPRGAGSAQEAPVTIR